MRADTKRGQEMSDASVLTKASTTNLNDIYREHEKQGMLANKEKA